jgi:membrane associated rhomboid family serine protease
MARIGSSPFSFPDFRGATRRLVLLNLLAFFALLVGQMALPHLEIPLAVRFGFVPGAFVHFGWFWQPFTYSFVHPSLIGTLFELLSLWFLAGFLQDLHTSSWVTNLYAVSVLGTAAAATAIYAASGTLGYTLTEIPIYGCGGGIFGLLVAIGALYGDMEFLLFFTIGIKAKYLAAVYALISIAMLFSEQRMYAFAQLGGALAGLFYIRLAPRRGVSFAFSETWYGLRNRYYRWKRRRAARKFEVYMRSQIDDDHDDKKHWN